MKRRDGVYVRGITSRVPKTEQEVTYSMYTSVYTIDPIVYIGFRPNENVYREAPLILVMCKYIPLFRHHRKFAHTMEWLFISAMLETLGCMAETHLTDAARKQRASPARHHISRRLHLAG